MNDESRQQFYQIQLIHYNKILNKNSPVRNKKIKKINKD